MNSDITEFPGAVPRFLSSRLGEWLDRLEESAHRLAGGAPEADAVHDVRVACRRVRGGLAAARPVVDWDRRARRLYRGLRRVRRELGRAREHDVALQLLDQLRADAGPAERPALAALMLVLTTPPGDRAGQVDDSPDVTRAIARLIRRGRRLAARLKVGHGLAAAADATSPPGHAGLPQPLDLRGLAVLAIDERYRSVMSRPLEPLQSLDDAAQHRFRIEVKKLRYTMEFFSPLFSKKLQARVAVLRAIQDLLGDLHDMADLARLAESARDRSGAAGAELHDGLSRLIERLESRRRRQFAGFEPLQARLAHPGFPPRPASPAGAPSVTPADLA